MASPFTSAGQRVVPSWSMKQASQPSPFAPKNPTGILTIDLGYGSGGYGDLPYGQNVIDKVNVSTTWTSDAVISTAYTSVLYHAIPQWIEAAN